MEPGINQIIKVEAVTIQRGIPILRMMRLSFLLMLLLFVSINLEAQIVNADGRGVIFNAETTVDLRLHTNGWSIGFNKGDLSQFDRTKYQGVEIGEIRHPKQDKRTFDLLAIGSNVINRSFVYGKQNNLYYLKYNVGRKRYFTQKSERKGAAVGITYSAGPVLGIVKPYLLDVFVRTVDPGNGQIRREIEAQRYDGTNDNVFLDQNSINGPSGWTKGWGEVSVQPGLHGKAAVHIDWGAFERFVKALEIGLMVDFYFKEVPIMIIEDNNQLFLNFYMNAHLGKRK